MVEVWSRVCYLLGGFLIWCTCVDRIRDVSSGGVTEFFFFCGWNAELVLCVGGVSNWRIVWVYF